MITIIGLALVNAAACAGPEDAPPEIGKLTQQLTSEDVKVAKEARAKLEAMGAEVVPALFEKLPAADWTLKPRLLEVLSAHGREFAKQKLKKGTENEKTYAALVFELTRAGEKPDHDTPEFKAMVEALLKAIKSEDKSLRAVAGAALVYDEDNTVFFDHLHEIIPALISSFDTELVVRRRAREDASEVVMVGICLRLDALIGDRLAYLEFSRRLGKQTVPSGNTGASIQRAMSRDLVAYRAQLDELGTYWNDWWKQHANMSVGQIGTLMIERDISLLKEISATTRHESTMAASFSLRLWTGQFVFNAGEAEKWWKDNRSTYHGPRVPR
jgi:hypothetical protein